MCFLNLFGGKDKKIKEIRSTISMELVKIKNKFNTSESLVADKNLVDTVTAMYNLIQTIDQKELDNICKKIKSFTQGIVQVGVNDNIKMPFYKDVVGEIIKAQSYEHLSSALNATLLQNELDRANNRLKQLKLEMIMAGGKDKATTLQKMEWGYWVNIQTKLNKAAELTSIEMNKEAAVENYNSQVDAVLRVNPSLRLKKLTGQEDNKTVHQKLIEIANIVDEIRMEDLGAMGSINTLSGWDDIDVGVTVTPNTTAQGVSNVAATTVGGMAVGGNTTVNEEVAIRDLRASKGKIADFIHQLDVEINGKNKDIAVKEGVLKELLMQFNEAEGNPVVRDALKHKIYMAESARQVLKKAVQLMMSKQNQLSKYMNVIDLYIEVKNMEELDKLISRMNIPELEGIAVGTREGVEKLNEAIRRAMTIEDVATGTEIDLGYSEALPTVEYSSEEDSTIARLMNELNIGK